MTSELEKIQRQVQVCKKCNLCKTRTNAVPGKGNFHAELLFVGEAPGRNEDKKGEPFVGAAGKKLSIALEYAGLSRDEVYITNVVKCRPPENRAPTPNEEESCEHYLNSEISLIKPKIICIMGNTAYHSLLGGGSITKNRGKIIHRDGKTYFLTVHPAAAIYNQSLLGTLKKDMKELVKTLKTLENENTS
ncbi:MAG TPA: uracil-DNA glycosylase [Nitrosopumilaceae archaeon]|nr:uracil-DNA glycosylase [Nitrosopumilaceae archaeon]